uniref:Protein kinase domain-containing protein n=1 Tax=Romanomermis culicivorax TaxID=13658 RepID=A0A915JLK8_ROMCU
MTAMMDENETSDQKRERKQQPQKASIASNIVASSTTSSPVPSPASGQLNLLTDYTLLRNRWEIIQKLFFGGFGEVYLARDLESDEKVAIKVESARGEQVQLPLELQIMKNYQGKKHALKLLGSGTDVAPNELSRCAELLKNSELRDLFQIHRDIKPSNFAVGRPETPDHFVLYLLDFGLARYYVDSNGNVKPPRPIVGIRGTLRYCSPVTLRREDLGRKDDLTSLFYTLFELFAGDALPWRSIKTPLEILELKEQYTVVALASSLPPQFVIVAEHVASLSFSDTPDYELIMDALKSLERESHIKATDPWDWDSTMANV